MAVPQVSDAELVEAFIGQADRYTRSGLKLGDCFSRTALDLVFRYGSVLQRSAVRQALIAYISLPDVNKLSARSVRHNTFEKHLDNLLVHVLRTIAADGTVARYDRDISSLLVETAGDRPRVPIARSDDDRGAASRLSANVSIQARVAELQGKAAESAIVTLEGLIQEAGELQVAGLKLNQISAAVAALTAKAKLAGFWVDKHESTNTNYVVSAEPEPTPEKWDEKYVRPN